MRQNRYKTKRYIASFFKVSFKNSTQQLIQKGKDHLSHIIQSHVSKMNIDTKNQSEIAKKNSVLRESLESYQNNYKSAQQEQYDHTNNIISNEDTSYRERKIIECRNKVNLQLEEIKKLEELCLDIN